MRYLGFILAITFCVSCQSNHSNMTAEVDKAMKSFVASTFISETLIKLDE